MPELWLRALVLCDDVRLEVGGTMTLVGVYADRLMVPPIDGEIVLTRFAAYAIIAGLRGASELKWRQSILFEGTSDSLPMMEGTEEHDPDSDEHRIVNIMGPVSFPRPGKYRLAFDFETKRERRSVDHHFEIEVGAPPQPE